jgi:hypothetical protein
MVVDLAGDAGGAVRIACDGVGQFQRVETVKGMGESCWASYDRP